MAADGEKQMAVDRGMLDRLARDLCNYPPELLLGDEHAGGGPAHAHVAVLPAFVGRLKDLHRFLSFLQIRPPTRVSAKTRMDNRQIRTKAWGKKMAAHGEI